jgi:hypothetical protein
MTVDLFFSLAIAAGFIAKERPSNKADIAYLYYHAFLHGVRIDGQTARPNRAPIPQRQATIHLGGRSEGELKRLDEYYTALPEETKARGVMSFAHCPPTEGDFLTTRLWDEFMAPHWRTPKERRPGAAADPAERERMEKAFVELNDQLKSAGPADREVTLTEADFVIVESKVFPRKLGKWAIVPPEA